MTKTKTLQRAFAGGELSSEMFGRVDDIKYQNGAALLRNFLVKPNGSAIRRPGTQFVREVKTSGKRTRLIPFTFSTSQALAIEMGEGYFRFHANGATLLVPGGIPAYVPNRSFVPADVSVVNNEIAFAVAHNLADDNPITFTSDNGVAIPGPLVIGTTYYARVMSATVIRVRATPGGADIDITTQGGVGGQHRLNYAYVAGDLVEGTPAGAPGNHYCIQNPTINGAAQKAPGAEPLYWHTQPATGEYEIWSPVVESNLFRVTHKQKNDILRLAHDGHAVLELRRLGATTWTLRDLAFGAMVSPPTGLVVTPTYGQSQGATCTAATPSVFTTPVAHGLSPEDSLLVDGSSGVGSGGSFGGGGGNPTGFYIVATTPTATTFTLKKMDGTAVACVSVDTVYFRHANLSSEISNTYVVTSVDAYGVESARSSEVTAAANNLFVDGSYNTLQWSAPSGTSPTRYNVYKKKTGLFGWIGQVEGTATLTFKDDAIAPDMGHTPPIQDTTLNASGSEPAAVGFFDLRCFFAGSNTNPQGVWSTRSGTDSDLSFHLPVQDSDRISFIGSMVGRVRHIVGLNHMMLLTSEAEYRVTPVNSDALTPSSISVRAQSFVGASEVQPSVVNNTIVFCADRGGHVYEMGFAKDSDGYLALDLSLRSAHLFDLRTIADQAYSKAPHPLLWFCSSNGTLLALSYVPEQEMAAWSQQVTDGLFESCASIPENGEDRLYVIANRTIGGVTKRFVERMAPMAPAAIADGFFVDAGLTYTRSGGAATVSTISGLSHLEGKTVAVLAKGLVQAQRVVTGGQISITPVAMIDGDKVTVGLPMTSDLQTVPATMAIEAFGSDRPKNVNRVSLRLQGSARCRVGPSLDALAQTKEIPVGALYTGPVAVTVPSSWNDEGQVFVRQQDPVPLTVVSLTIELSVGGG